MFRATYSGFCARPRYVASDGQVTVFHDDRRLDWSATGHITPRQGQGGAAVRRAEHRVAARAARLPRARRARHAAAAVPSRTGLRHRPLHHRHLPRASTARPEPCHLRPGSTMAGCSGCPPASKTSTSCSSWSPNPAPCTATASIFRACATSPPPWPPTSGNRSPSAMTRATSPRSGCSTATGFSAGRSAPNTPPRPSPSKTSRQRVPPTTRPDQRADRQDCRLPSRPHP